MNIVHEGVWPPCNQCDFKATTNHILAAKSTQSYTIISKEPIHNKFFAEKIGPIFNTIPLKNCNE